MCIRDRDKDCAEVISSQDSWEFWDMLRDKTPFKQDVIKDLFQCKSCNNLILFTQKGRFDFTPTDKDGDYSNLLISYHGDRWKAVLRGEVTGGVGDLYWHSNVDSGRIRKMEKAELKTKYFELKEKFTKLDILYYCHLIIDEKEVDLYDSDPIEWDQ